jgi:hypothetical protein
MQDEAYVVYYEKSVIDPKVMTAVGFYVKRDYTGDYTNVETLYRPSSSYVFEMGNSTMFYTGYYNHDEWFQRKSVCSEYSVYGTAVPKYYSRESIAAAIVGTPMQYSCWEQYNEQDMTKFFGLYTKYPCIEYLTKMGYKYFVLAKHYGTRTYDAIKWSGKSIEQIFKLKKQDLRRFLNHYPEIGRGDEPEALVLRLYQLTLKDSNRPPIEDLRGIAQKITGFFTEMKPMLKHQNLMKTIAYIDRQYRIGKRQYHSKPAVLQVWRDYIEQCMELGHDLKRLENVFPTNLHRAHESATSQVKIKLSEIERQKVARRALELESYRFAFDGYLIRPAASANEIIDEGKRLRHCVGGYTQRHADGQTSIFMIRKVADPDTPYFTMELKDGKITQTYGYKHLLPSGDLLKLLDAFKKAKINKKPREKTRAVRQEVAV